MAHNHKHARRHSYQSGHPEGSYYSRKGGGPGSKAEGKTATDRNREAREGKK